MVWHVLFWILVAIDVAGIGLVFLLGLAAAKPSGTSELLVAALLLGVPVVLLGLAILLFLLAKSPLLRGTALVVAGAPLLFLLVGTVAGRMLPLLYQDAEGNPTYFRSAGMKRVEAAIAGNDAEAVRAAAIDADLGEIAKDGNGVLVIALRRLQKSPGPPDVLQALLQAGADPNGDDPLASPLSVAILGVRQTGIEPVRVLLDAGADPNGTNQFGEPAFFAATAPRVDVAVLELLLDRGADLQARSRDGSMAVHRAALGRNWAATLLLLRRGADANAPRTPNGQSLRDMAEASARMDGKQPGLAEVLTFLQTEGERR